jgi:hypothetical protein
LLTLYARRRRQVRTHLEAKFERPKYSQSIATRAASRPFTPTAIAFAAIAKPSHSESGTAPLSISSNGDFMLSKNSRYKKVVFQERMPISRTPDSRLLIVIIEIRRSSKEDRYDPKDSELINFANSIVRLQIMNKGWPSIEKRVQHMKLHELPVLGDPAKEEGNLIAWVVRTS